MISKYYIMFLQITFTQHYTQRLSTYKLCKYFIRVLTKSKYELNHQICAYASIFYPFAMISEYDLMFMINNITTLLCIIYNIRM
jgi:hypothetical protein